MTATLEHRDGLHTLRFERLLAHPIEAVWRALTDNDELAHWFPAAMHGPREAGAVLRFVFPPEPGQTPADSAEEGASMPGLMLVFEPPRLLEYRWIEDMLRWELRAEGDSTRLVFTHTFADEGKAARDASGWESCLGALESRLAGRAREPFSWERHNVLFEAYAAKFGPAASAKRGPEE